jgi:hypothetical protein
MPRWESSESLAWGLVGALAVPVPARRERFLERWARISRRMSAREASICRWAAAMSSR